ncbi:hypothetical protein TIFTF001_040414 [Ficus carica]|uniref:Uncharacterized protein n=1 Tax=Ficus carica TaxID=3494 RepID=A0AA87YU69_FICCA|nr:hypothetical protein TIFTF001_040414 [Ficus carica]
MKASYGDNTIFSAIVVLTAARAAKADNSNEGSSVVTKPGTEQFKKCPKSTAVAKWVDTEQFSTAVAKWVVDFFIKVDAGIHINLGMVASTLSRHRSKPHVYIGCMKFGPVLAQK